MITTSRERLAWLAGVIDGEGCFHFDPHNSITLSIAQKDRRLLDKALEVVVHGRIYLCGKVYQLRVYTFEHVQAVAAATWFELSEVKKDQYRWALRQFHAHRVAKEERAADRARMWENRR